MTQKKKEASPFNFGESPLVKQTEKTVVDGYDRIENGGSLQRPQVTDVPMEQTQNINVPIPVSLHQQLKIYAAQTKQNMKDLVVVAIREYMERQEKTS